MSDKITVLIGSVVSGNNGQMNDDTQQVEFTGEELASRTEYGVKSIAHGGGITDTRGTTETLYKTDDGQLVVHVENWSRWQGEPTTYTLHDVAEADLGPTGQWAALGAEAGYGRPLTLDEAFAQSGESLIQLTD